MLDAGPDLGVDPARDLGPEAALDGDGAERDRRLHLALPHLAEIGELDETLVGVGEAALVDQDAAVDLAAQHRVLDEVEAHLDGAEVAEEAEQEGGGGAGPGDGDAPARRPVAGGDQQRPDAEAGGAARPQHRVAVADVAEAGDRDLRHLQHAPVQCLDVVERDLEAADVMDQVVEGEGVVGAGRDAEGQHAVSSIQAVRARRAAAAASSRRHALRSRLPTRLEMPRTSPTGSPWAMAV